MDFESLMGTYGYIAVLIGVFIEGESVMIMGGLASKLGYLELPGVVASGFAASLTWDQVLFFTGRRYGQAGLARFPRLKPGVDKVLALIERHSTPVIFVFPFLHGVRGVSPFAIGMSRVPVRQFILLNIAATMIWATALAAAGYLFGRATEVVLRSLKSYQIAALGGIVCIFLFVWLIKRHRSRRDSANGSPQNGL